MLLADWLTESRGNETQSPESLKKYCETMGKDWALKCRATKKARFPLSLVSEVTMSLVRCPCKICRGRKFITRKYALSHLDIYGELTEQPPSQGNLSRTDTGSEVQDATKAYLQCLDDEDMLGIPRSLFFHCCTFKSKWKRYSQDKSWYRGTNGLVFESNVP